MKLGQGKILIVDDLQDNLQVTLNCLFDGGYLNILCAKNGNDALDIVYAEHPQLIILDWDMPVMSGIDVIKKLQKNQVTKLIPVIVSTGAMLSSKDLEEALGSGAIDYIRKPFEPIELLARVKSALDFSNILITLNTQKLQIEKQSSIFEENEKRLLALLNASIEACLFVDQDIIIEANQTFYNFTGYKKEEVIHHSIYSFFLPEFRKIIAELEAGNKKLWSVGLLNRQGGTLSVEMIVRRHQLNDKKVLAISIFNLNEILLQPGDSGEVNLRANELKMNTLKNEIRQLKKDNKTIQNQLQLKTLQSAYRDDFMINLLKNLEELSLSMPEEKVSCRKQIISCISQLKQYQIKGIWEEFQLRFAEVHTNFYDKLLRSYPVLTETDLRLCAFIKLKMTTKEIAAVINQPANSVKVARNRLRSKLQIEDASVSLLIFLASF